MRSIEKIAPHYFLDFLKSICPIVENNLQSWLIQDTPSKERIYRILNEISWSEWQNKPKILINSLSQILITLFYDKILFSFQQEPYSTNIDDFLDKSIELIFAHDRGKIASKKARNQFSKFLNDLWKQKSELDTPIMKNRFSFNHLLYLLFTDWDCCVKFIELVQKIKQDTRGKNQLLLPYIFEIGIPEQQKQLQGQIFTPLQVIKFICKQNITDQTTTIIDPACGTGTLLLGALQELTESKINHLNHVELIGIEKDPILTDIANSAISYLILVNSITSVNWEIICDDFFNYDSLNFSRKGSGTTTLLMNPPYTRHEQLSLEYKDFVKAKIEFDLQELSQQSRKPISRRSGLYVYFLIHATLLLEEGDNLGLIIPNSWMDVDYGEFFQNFILDNYLIESIVCSRSKKLISNANVNTTVLKLKKKTIKYSKDKSSVNFVSIGSKADLENLVKLNGFSNLNSSLSRIQVVSVKHKDLYRKSKWGVYFRAPKDYFNLMDILKDKLISLGEVAHVRRGFTSGANEFFYVGKPGETNYFFKSEWNPETGQLMLYLKDELVIKEFIAQGFHPNEPMFLIEKDYWMHPIDITHEKVSWQYSYKDNDGSIWIPNYLVKSPRNLRTYKIQEDDLKYVVILVPYLNSDKELKSGVKEYICWGESWIPAMGKKFNQRPTCCSRKSWFSLPSDEYKVFNILCLMTINDRFPFFYNPHNFFFDARLYGIRLIQEKDVLPYYFLLLNSLLTTLQMELLGRSNLGEGGLDIKVYEYELIKVPKLEFLNAIDSEDINNAFLQFLEYSLYSVTQEKPKQIRQITNELVVRIFKLPQKLIDSLFNDLKRLVKMRIEKAKDSSFNSF
ncbi:MAG: N-6 DNA methylase [Candidatus Thorarchaeota archaeon]